MTRNVLFVLAAELAIVLFGGFSDLLYVFLVGNTGYLLYELNKHRREEDDLRDSEQNAAKSVEIARETLPYLRGGLNRENAESIAKIIKDIGQVAAVSITDRETQLAYLGAGCEHHHAGDRILTMATREVLETGLYKIVRTQKELNCPRQNTCDCPLASAVIVPMFSQGEVVGTIKLYDTKSGQPAPNLIRLAIGMAQLLSIQIELAELDHQAKLAAEAQLNALHAQINPHFFFNVLNTIIATSRTNPNRARRLLIHLSEFFRSALKAKGTLISLQEEMKFVNTYLILEKARFGRKLMVKQDIPEDLLEARIPRLSIQPIVENAVKHGISQKMGNGTVRIMAENREGELYIAVCDDGVGITPDRLSEVLLPGVGSGNGVGLANVHERFIGLYGKEYGLEFDSELDRGTTVTMHLPLTYMD